MNWRSSTRFYGINGLCFPLYIDDPFLIGWEYSVFVFLGINLIGFVNFCFLFLIKSVDKFWSGNNLFTICQKIRIIY